MRVSRPGGFRQNVAKRWASYPANFCLFCLAPSFRTSERIFVMRLARRSRMRRLLPSGSVQRNISSTCCAAWTEWSTPGKLEVLKQRRRLWKAASDGEGGSEPDGILAANERSTHSPMRMPCGEAAGARGRGSRASGRGMSSGLRSPEQGRKIVGPDQLLQ